MDLTMVMEFTGSLIHLYSTKVSLYFSRLNLFQGDYSKLSGGVKVASGTSNPG